MKIIVLFELSVFNSFLQILAQTSVFILMQQICKVCRYATPLTWLTISLLLLFFFGFHQVDGLCWWLD